MDPSKKLKMIILTVDLISVILYLVTDRRRCGITEFLLWWCILCMLITHAMLKYSLDCIKGVIRWPSMSC